MRENLRPLCMIACSVIWGAHLAPGTARAQTPGQEPAPQYQPPASATSGNLLNPSISVIGWVQAEWGDEEDVSQTFSFREAEFGFQSAVDPYFRADYFIAVHGGGEVELEEGFFTILTFPRRFGLKAGHFRSNFGRFNRTHPPETFFADRPLAAEQFFGEEGLVATGVSLSYLVPNPFDIYLNLDAEVTNTPEGHGHEEEGEAEAEEEHEEAVVFEPAGPRDLLYTARLGGFVEAGEATNLSVGGSFASGAAGEHAEEDGRPEVRRNNLAGFDMILRWKNPRRAIYRSLTWQTEGTILWPDAEEGENLDSVRGAFSAVDYQFSRRWHMGIRGDWTEIVGGGGHEAGGLAYLTFTPSEFSLVSLQGRRVRLADGSTDNRLFVKVTANIGPHGAHPF